MRLTVTMLAILVALLLLAVPLPTEAQSATMIPRIGFLWYSSPALVSWQLDAFREGLRQYGYVEGQNIAIEHRFGEDNPGRLRELVAELVQLPVAVILTQGTAAALVAKGATSTIPIVLATAGDPVGAGLVSSLARPGGNITGLTNLSGVLSSKRLEILKETRPRLSRVAVLWDANDPVAGDPYGRRATEEAGRILGLKLQMLAVLGRDDFQRAFDAARRARAEALVVLPSPILPQHRRSIVELAAQQRLPAIYQSRAFTDVGGLMAYGPNPADLLRRAAYFVDKILKGAKPADLPVEQPTKFELVINMKTAKALGLTVPPSLLLRADKIIE